MSGYDKRIQYLDYCEQGERRFGAGFVKLENRNDVCGIFLQISGLSRRDRFTAPLFMLTPEGERELIRLKFADGCVRTFMEGLPANDMDGQGLEYDALQGLRVPIAAGREVRCVWKSKVTVPTADETLMPVQAEREETVGENAVPAAADWTGRDMTMPESRSAPQKAAVHNDKWQQIFSIYPQIHPFEDERVYLSVGLGDFVLLSAQSYPLVNNSFLLHGFYSYGHLILARMQNRSGVRYYVGVPGSYYERERRIAVMFGFESFECRREPARDGDFGYYMIPVML